MTSKIITLETGWQLAVYESTTSTSDVIFAAPEMREGLCVLAGEQTKGRGRHGRIWTSLPDDGMYLSIALAPMRETKEWPTLSFVAALSLYQALKSLFPDLEAGLKWPNDVLVRQHKIGGLLLEARNGHVVLGCGVNLKNAPQISGASFPATDIESETGTPLTPFDFAKIFLERLHHHYQNWQVTGFSAVFDLYKSHLLFVSQMITVTQGDKRLSGIMRGITPQGDLLLESSSGTLVCVTTGDVNLMDISDASCD